MVSSACHPATRRGCNGRYPSQRRLTCRGMRSWKLPVGACASRLPQVCAGASGAHLGGFKGTCKQEQIHMIFASGCLMIQLLNKPDQCLKYTSQYSFAPVECWFAQQFGSKGLVQQGLPANVSSHAFLWRFRCLLYSVSSPGLQMRSHHHAPLLPPGTEARRASSQMGLWSRGAIKSMAVIPLLWPRT